MDGDGVADAGWHEERAELLRRLADETARVAALSQQVHDLKDEPRPPARPEPAAPRDAGARLLAREAERHRAEVVRLQEAEQVALTRAEDLLRQLREVRAELREVRTQHATELMQRELEVTRWQAEAAGLQAAARRRAELARPSAEELLARQAQHEADEKLLAAAQDAPSLDAVDEGEDAVIVPPEWSEEPDPAPPEQPLVPTRDTLPDLPDKARRRPGFWRR